MFLKIIIMMVSFSLASSSVFSQNNLKLNVIVNEKGEFYKIKNDGNGLDEKELLLKSQWNSIIANGSEELALQLIRKIGYHLSDKEKIKYLKTALLRHQDKLTNSLIADSAYNQLRTSLSESALLNIRINSKYRKNLSVNLFKYLFFDTPSKKFNTIEKAVRELKSEYGFSNIMDEQVKKELLTTIALSQDIEILNTLIYDDEFEIAFASWVALSRIVPEEFAYDILSYAIHRDDKIKYDTTQGCLVSHDYYDLGKAAYSLFSDYLTEEQLFEIMQQDHLLLSGERKFWVKNQQTANALNKIGVNQITFPNLQSFNFREKFKKMSIPELKIFMQKYKYYYTTYRYVFDEKMRIALTELSYSLDNANIGRWTLFALQARSKQSRLFLDFLLSEKNSKINIEVVLKTMIDTSKSWHKIWPIHFKTLKPNFEVKLKEYGLEEEYEKQRKRYHNSLNFSLNN